MAKALGLAVEPVSTQVIPRDRHAMYFATLGVVASSVERLATEIRHLQRTEVLEAEEFFSEGQKGSSAMPHKRNPVLTENLTGLARMVRAYVMPALENVALWHERDISHSSVERMIGPDATVTLDFALARLDRRDRQARRLSGEHAQESRPARRPRPFAARAARAHPEGHAPRGRLSARAAQRHEGLARRGRFSARCSRPTRTCASALSATPRSRHNFDLDYHLKHVDTIFKRVFGKAGQLAEGVSGLHATAPPALTTASAGTPAPRH